MEAMETFELPAENAIAVTEKRCYTVEDLQHQSRYCIQAPGAKGVPLDEDRNCLPNFEKEL